MFLEWWMIVTFVAVVTYFMIRSYNTGFDDGVAENVVVGVDSVIEALQAQKIVEVVKDKNGNDKIIPGDIEEFIRLNGGNDYE